MLSNLAQMARSLPVHYICHLRGSTDLVDSQRMGDLVQAEALQSTPSAD